MCQFSTNDLQKLDSTAVRAYFGQRQIESNKGYYVVLLYENPTGENYVLNLVWDLFVINGM